jgi:hypothetical protein
MFDIDFLNNLAVVSSVAIPIVIAITQALKFAWIKDEYAPFVAVLVGIGVAFLLVHDINQDITHTILSGILFGLSSSGLYSGLKSTQKALAMRRANEMVKKGHKNG